MGVLDSGVTWNEALPDDSTVANKIDDWNKDTKIALRSRLALEHVWPNAHTGTDSAGRHTYISFVTQTAMAVLTAGAALWIKSSGQDLFFTDSADGDYMIAGSGGGIAVIPDGTGTQGGIPICSSANGYGVEFLVSSVAGMTLHSNTNTGDPTWSALNLASANQVTGILTTSNGGTGIATSMMKVVEYEGDAQDDREVVHGMGAEPDVVLIVCLETVQLSPNIWVTGFAAGYSRDFSSGGIGTNFIKSVDGTKIVLGTSNNVNQNNKTYAAVCMIQN